MFWHFNSIIWSLTLPLSHLKRCRALELFDIALLFHNRYIYLYCMLQSRVHDRDLIAHIYWTLVVSLITDYAQWNNDTFAYEQSEAVWIEWEGQGSLYGLIMPLLIFHDLIYNDMNSPFFLFLNKCIAYLTFHNRWERRGSYTSVHQPMIITLINMIVWPLDAGYNRSGISPTCVS